jgi:hypothetical protein
MLKNDSILTGLRLDIKKQIMPLFPEAQKQQNNNKTFI